MTPRLSDAAQSEIDDLRAAGVVLTDADIVLLHDIGRELDRPSPQGLAAGIPIPCGNAWLWPMTGQASEWHAATLEWFDGNSAMEALALAFAMAHARTLDAFATLYTYAAARDAVLNWYRSLAATDAEISAAAHAVILQSEGPGETPRTEAELEQAREMQSAGAFSLAAIMVARCGGTADEWERLVSHRFATDVLKCVIAQSGATGTTPDPYSHLVVYTRRLAYAAQQILERHQKSAAAPEAEARDV